MPRTLQSSTSKAYIQKDYYILYIRKKDLSYDYTYLDSRDSVTILMTITTSVPYKPDNIDITNNSGTQKSSVSGWRKRSIPTHLERHNPPTIIAKMGLKRA